MENGLLQIYLCDRIIENPKFRHSSWIHTFADYALNIQFRRKDDSDDEINWDY